MTYYEAISELQQRGVAALKVAQSTQIAALAATRDFAVAFAAPASAMLAIPTTLDEARKLSTSFAFALLEQQVAYTKELTDVLTEPLRPAAAAPVESMLPTAPAIGPTLDLATNEKAAVSAPEVSAVDDMVEPVVIEPAAPLSVETLAEPMGEPLAPISVETLAESMGEPIAPISVDAIVEPVVEPIAPISADAIVEPRSASRADPISEHVVDVAAPPTADAIADPVGESTPAPIVDSVAEPVIESVAEAAVVVPIVEPGAQLPVAGAPPKISSAPSALGSTVEAAKREKPIPASSKNAAAKPRKATPGKPLPPKRGPKKK